jgi:hypothetical protein
LGNGLEEVDEVLFNQIQLITEPHAHVGNDLVVPAAACMELSCYVCSDNFA